MKQIDSEKKIDRLKIGNTTITKDEYEEWLTKTTRSIDWSLLSDYEKEDMTENTKELACVAGACEIL